MRLRRTASVLALAAVLAGDGALAQRFYSCVDERGRRLSSDRPIPECLDREQTEYGATGTPRGRLPPALSTQEQRAIEDRERQTEFERQRAAEQRRADLRLLDRYPDPTIHARAAVDALSRVEQLMEAAQRRSQALERERANLEVQLQAARDSDARVAAMRGLTSVEAQINAHRQTVTALQDERQRTQERINAERERLVPLWAQTLGGSRPGSAATPVLRTPASSATGR